MQVKGKNNAVQNSTALLPQKYMFKYYKEYKLFQATSQTGLYYCEHKDKILEHYE